MSKSWLGYCAGIVGGAIAIFGTVIYLQNSQLFMHSEYKTIKTIVNQLATKNVLGDDRLSLHLMWVLMQIG